MADDNKEDSFHVTTDTCEELSLREPFEDRVSGGIPLEGITDNRQELINDLRDSGQEELLSGFESEEDSELEQSYNALKTDEEGKVENLSELKYVTPVKDQCRTAHCWAFAGAATIETNMWKQHPDVISSSQTYGETGGIIIRVPSDENVLNIKADTIYNNPGRSVGLELSLKNNSKVGGADLILKAAKNSNFKGNYKFKDFITLNKISIDPAVPVIDRVGDTGLLTSQRETRANNVYAQVTDAIGSKKPALKLYQYDAWGINRKEIRLSAGNISTGDGYFELSGDNPYLEFLDDPSDSTDEKGRITFGKYDQKPKKVVLSGRKSLGDYKYTGECVQPDIGELELTLPSGNVVKVGSDCYSVDYINDVKAGTAKAVVRLAYKDESSGISYGGTCIFIYKIVK